MIRHDHLEKNRLLPEEQKGSRRKCDFFLKKINLRSIDAYYKIAGKEKQI